MLVLFTLALFVNSALLFLVQPMVAKMLLPLLGGSPAVWNTCVLFFQAALLAGYAYSHFATQRLGLKRQVPLHCLLLLLPLFFLPLHLPAGASPPRASTPIPWLLLTLAVTVGLPFFVTATGGPLLQRWFAATRHKAAEDPYFLYAASNLGSFCGLFGYLFLLEPRFTLAQQSRIWAVGYGVALALIAACAAVVIRNHRVGEGPAEEAVATAGVPTARKLRWIALAAAPSSLMLGVTTYLTTDIGSFPLLWVLPLALYLVTFIIAFARWGPALHPAARIALPVLVALGVLLDRLPLPLPARVLAALATFTVVALVCHGELARDRPPASGLTEFYLLLSLGGVLGGAFNGLAAPVVFNGPYEYPIALALACYLCLPSRGAGRRAEAPADGAPAPEAERPLWPRAGGLDLLAALGLALLAGAGVYLVSTTDLRLNREAMAWAVAIPTALCVALFRRPAAFGLALGAILIIATFDPRGWNGGRLIHQERSFFGVHRVSRNDATSRTSLMNGTTLHGTQDFRPEHRRDHLSYYSDTGPIGEAVQRLGYERKRVAVVGLGAGALASYGEPGQQLTFYEIDPSVERIASDARYFSYLSDARARGVDLQVVMGDARLRIQEAAPRSFDLIVLDAFSSDSVPVHLLTREAMRIYLDRLAEHGVIAMHLSNKHLDLGPVVAALVWDAKGACRIRVDTRLTPEELRAGKDPSMWALVARLPEDFGPLANDPKWSRVRTVPGISHWTDDFSNILSALRGVPHQ